MKKPTRKDKEAGYEPTWRKILFTSEGQRIAYKKLIAGARTFGPGLPAKGISKRTLRKSERTVK